MFTYDEVIKIIWFISLIIDLVIYKKYYEEIVLGPLKIFLTSLQVILGICFVIPIIELIISWFGFWECWISGILLFSFCLLQKYMFIKNQYGKNLKIIEKVVLLIGTSVLSLFCSLGTGSLKLFLLNCLLIIFSIIIFFVTYAVCFYFFIIDSHKRT